MLLKPICPLIALAPLCALKATKIAALQATVLLLLAQLIKARIQIKFFSALGITLLLIQTLVFLTAAAGTAAAASGAFGQRSAPVPGA